MTSKEKIARSRIRTPTRNDFRICSPVIYHCATFAWLSIVSILVHKLYTLKNNTFFEMSISKKTNKFLDFFQSAYVVLLIKQHTCKVSTLRLHIQKTISIFYIKLNIPFVIAFFPDLLCKSTYTTICILNFIQLAKKIDTLFMVDFRRFSKPKISNVNYFVI